MTLLITVLVVIRNIFILVLERAPRVEVVEEVVECIDIIFGTVFLSELRYRLDSGEAALGFEDIAPQFVVLALFQLLFGRGFDIGVLVDGVKLATLDGIKKNFGSFLNALKEAIIFGASGGGFLVRVMTENLLAVCTLNLFFGSFVAVF
jgi:hypothetical protein